jgi:hypothetical protein
MGKGPGRRQRTIAALIEANPDGAWAYEDLCAVIYGKLPFTRAQKSGVGRALKSMRLPGTWTTGRFSGDRRWWLHDPCNLASVRKAVPSWVNPAHFQPGGIYFDGVEKAQARVKELERSKAELLAAV